MNDFPVVALVCSAGGLDALTHVLAPLPADLPATIVALQHLPPDARTHLPDILGRRTALPVASAAHGDALTPGRLLIAPPGHHTLITAEQTIALIPSGAIPPNRPSADLLLTTLALAARIRAVAVVLSGHGTDGATGATAVHHFGGTRHHQQRQHLHCTLHATRHRHPRLRYRPRRRPRRHRRPARRDGHRPHSAAWPDAR